MTRPVARIPVHTGPAGWNSILPPAPARASLTGAQGCDIAIVGAGFAGLSAARRLVQIDPRLKIIVVDAGRVAESSAGRNSGFMIDLPHELTSSDYAGTGEARDRVLTRLNRHAIDVAEAVQRDYGLPEGYFQRSGKINAAASDVGEQANRSYADHLRAMGEPHQMLDAAAMRQITGSGYYRAGLYTPGTAVIQPAGYIRGLAAGLEAAGVTVFESSPVTAFESVGAAWALTTPQGRMHGAKGDPCQQRPSGKFRVQARSADAHHAERLHDRRNPRRCPAHPWRAGNMGHNAVRSDGLHRAADFHGTGRQPDRDPARRAVSPGNADQCRRSGTGRRQHAGQVRRALSDAARRAV